MRVDFDSEGSHLSESYGPPDHYQQYYREQEPIIEIIIKESNETLPAPPPPPVQAVKPTKEPVHVFYVKYKKNPKGKGEDDIIYEAPVPAITPPTDELDEESPPHSVDTHYEAASLPPPPSTTLRTVIHPDSEIYHGSGLKVTFGESEVKSSDAAYGESNAPEPSVALPHKEAQNRESSVAVNTQSIKRQGVYQTIPQEVYDQNPPKAAASTSVPTFQPNSFNQQNLQNLQFQQSQSQQQKATFTRQAQPPPSFRPQHTAAIFNNQPQPHQQQQFQQRQPFQQQANQVQQRQVPRQQNNLYSTIQTPPQNHQQVPQSRPPPQQFDQRAVQYSQPLNNPSQPVRQQPFQTQDQQHLRQQQIVHQQHLAHQQQIQQQQTTHNQLRSQPIHVPNQDFGRYSQQVFPTAQPVNTAAPLPSKPIHPQFAQHYQQQIGLAQQQRQNFIPSTHQPQQVNPSQPQPTNQQQYRFPQQVVNIPRQPSTSQPLQPFHYSTQPPPINNLSFRTQAPSVLPNLSGAEVIKSIPQSEEHLQPQVDHQAFRPIQPSAIQPTQQPTIEQVNQLNLLRNQQQINQLNRQIASQQAINQQYNHQLYLQQQKQQQLESNDFAHQQQQLETKKVHQRPAQFSHPNQLASTTSQPKPTTASYQTKYSQLYSQSPSTTPTPTEETPISTTEDPAKVKEQQKKFKDNLAALPDEVPDDIREQLLSSGILGNADISILDYDKVGDIPIENLPPEALENFYGAGSAPVPAVAIPDKVPREVENTASEAKDVEMKVVRYDPNTEEGQQVENSYIKDDATQVDSVILNDSKYNRYLPLQVSGSNFPLPHASLLDGKKVNSVVVLAPVDYDFVKEQEEEEQREGRSGPVQVQGVRFIAGGSLKNLIKNPTEENYKQWLTKEKTIPSDRQSVVLLVVS